MTAEVNILTGPGAACDGGADLLNGAIARQLATLRRARQLSFDDLAARCGVSKGMLVQLEQGKANPSIATLCRLATGLRVSVADLLGPGAQASAVQVIAPGGERTLWHGPRGGSAALLIGSQGPDMLELWDWTLQPGERYDGRPHSPGTLEIVHVVAGSLALEVEGVAHVVTAGASACARTDRPHAYSCHGRKRTRFTMAVAERARG